MASNCSRAQASFAFHKTGQGFPGCVRCAEVVGAGVCPEPGTLERLMLHFERTAVLCAPQNCQRHQRGYWSPAIQERIQVFKTAHVDRTLENEAGGREMAELLGLRGKYAQMHGQTRFARELKVHAWHRVRALLAMFDVVLWADRRGLRSVLILEGDVRPVPKNQLSPEEVDRFGTYLANSGWSTVRLGGYFAPYGHYRAMPLRPNVCPPECRCNPVPNASRLCEVTSPPALSENSWSSEPFCPVKDSVAFAVNARSYPAFRQARLRALAALRSAVNLSKAAARRHLAPLNSTLGLSPIQFQNELPWFDVWLPASLDQTYVLPVLVEQQTRQADGDESSRRFARQCHPSALPLDSARPRKEAATAEAAKRRQKERKSKSASESHWTQLAPGRRRRRPRLQSAETRSK